MHVGGDHTADALASYELVTGFQSLMQKLGSEMKVGVFEENGPPNALAAGMFDSV